MFSTKEVLFAVATRVQADQTIDIIRHVRRGTLDPYQVEKTEVVRVIIDAIKPSHANMPRMCKRILRYIRSSKHKKIELSRPYHTNKFFDEESKEES